MNNFAQWIIKQYSKWLVRLLITILAVIITQLVYMYYVKQAFPMTPVCFQNLWLICAYFITILITLVLFICIYFTTNSEIRETGFLGFIALIIFIIILGFCLGNLDSSSKVLIFIPPIFVGIIFFIDYKLSKSGLCQLRKVYFSFDLAVFVGVLMVAILQLININDNPILVYGFGGGASAFQLIMANIIFDPLNYIQNSTNN